MYNLSWLHNLGLPSEWLAAIVVFSLLIWGGPRWLDVIARNCRESRKVNADIRRRDAKAEVDLRDRILKINERERKLTKKNDAGSPK